MDNNEFDKFKEFKEFQEYQEWKKEKAKKSSLQYRPSPMLKTRWGKALCACMIAVVIITTIVLGISQCIENDSRSQDKDVNSVQNERPSVTDNNQVVSEMQDSIVGTWKYFCNEQSLVEFGRNESEYGLSIVNTILNKYIEDTGFAPVDEIKNLSDDRYFIDRNQLRQGIIGQEFFFGADNSLHVSILFQPGFQVYPAQPDYYYDASYNLVEGKIGEPITVPDELQQYEIIGGYELINIPQSGIILQTYFLTFENIKLVDSNTLQLEYVRPGHSDKVVLFFTRVQ